MPRYDDRYRGTRLYVGHLSSRTRTRDLEHIFSRYGRVRDVDMKRDYAFVEFSDPRDADDARYSLNGRDIDGSRIIVEIAKGVPRDAGGYHNGSRDYMGRGPPPGSGRCFNCGLDGHWARDCKAGDWKNKCYRCGDRGHIERNCQNSPKKLSGRGRSYSRSPSPRRRRSRSRSRSRGRKYSRSRSPVKRVRSIESEERRSRSPPRHNNNSKSPSSPPPPPPKGGKHSATPEDERSPEERGTSPIDKDMAVNGGASEYEKSPKDDDDDEIERADPRYDDDHEKNISPHHENDNSHAGNSPIPEDDNGSPQDDGGGGGGDDDDERHGSPEGGSVSP
ncbi:hypothetical protein DM860_010724 [Cuscuta australis]|uniref:Uncharacterized protein n=1 Tax=Cuscuta australis TaxID=267555 RepID=A0A328DZR9_9ASTE|nr:hypothetical protein DM860_010724 [Cuscuta australis]